MTTFFLDGGRAVDVRAFTLDGNHEPLSEQQAAELGEIVRLEALKPLRRMEEAGP